MNQEPSENTSSLPELPPKIETKNVKHTFTSDELRILGQSLARAWGAKGNVEREFDNVKANYKARITEQEARIGLLSTSIEAQFEMRDKPCVVIFHPETRKKHFITEEDYADFGASAAPVLIEDMLEDDFQQELISAELKFEKQERIALFPETGPDNGAIIVGFLGQFWYAAVRCKIGNQKLEERLDSEQPITAKARFDAIKMAAERYSKWLVNTLGKDNAKGFSEPLEKALAPHSERAE
jgi:hypothetical protein